jgi:hypothetical protein
MIEADLLPKDYSNRMAEVLAVSWRILKSQFIEKRHKISKEAPFQHYFARIISTVGEAYCTARDDRFLVDLETRLDKIKGKTKYIDITCEFPKQKVSCAVELKFKTAKQGAQDFGRIDVFVDIEALEIAGRDHGYNFGRFYMITDSRPYIGQSKKGVGTIFTTHDGASTPAEKIFHSPKSKGREHVKVQLSNPYKFHWEQCGEWYFLELNVLKGTDKNSVVAS